MPLPWRPKPTDNNDTPKQSSQYRHYPRRILALHAFNTALQTSGACTFVVAASLSLSTPSPSPPPANLTNNTLIAFPRLTTFANRTVLLSSRIVPVFSAFALASSLRTSYLDTGDIEAWRCAARLLRSRERKEVFDKPLWAAGVVGGLVMGVLAGRRGGFGRTMRMMGVDLGVGTAVVGGMGVGVGGVAVGRGVASLGRLGGVSREGW